MSELHEECGVVAIYHFVNDEALKEPSELCGSIKPTEITRLLPRMLLDVQNRGQLSAGITSYNEKRTPLLSTYKDVGTVAEAFHQNHKDEFEKIMKNLMGNAGIGHVRYATCGRDDVSYAHPFERPHIKRNKWFSFAFNGQLANYEQLKEQLLQQDPNACFARETDAEIIMHLLCAALKNSERDLLQICRKTIVSINASPRNKMELLQYVANSTDDDKRQGASGSKFIPLDQIETITLDGAFSIAFLNALGEMFLARDPHGIKPLCYATDGKLFAAASESVALFNLGFNHDDIKDVPPGGCVIVKPDGTVSVETYTPSPRTAHCFFEWIYFANAASVLDGKSVYMARKALGERLAALELKDYEEAQKSGGKGPVGDLYDGDTIVVPVPDTSRAAAEGMARALNLPCQEGLMRNRYSGRTFIEGGDSRVRKAMTKYTPMPQVLEGKRILLVEDSIVRSTTMRVLIERIKTVGHAKEVHVRVACPPIVAPCFYGIDMSTYGELFATQFFREKYSNESLANNADLTVLWQLTPEMEVEMAEKLGCDSLRYLPVRELAKAIGIPTMNLCLACVNHEYPTEYGFKLSQRARQIFAKGLAQSRTYES